MDLLELFTRKHDGTTEQISRFATMFGGREPDSEMASVLRVLVSSDPKPFYELPPKLARLHPLPPTAVKILLTERDENTDPEDVGEIDNRTFSGPDGDVKIRIYKPASAAVDILLPVVLYIHGGGWVIANLDTYDASARAICNGAHCIVVATHYRQAPENKYPAAHDDAFAAYQWVLENAQSLGGDPRRIAIVGESAGGNMAAAICIRARDMGLQLPLHQVLVYPVASANLSSESAQEMTQAQPLNTKAMSWFFDHYFNTPADGDSPWISLITANLAGLPTATIINAELDPLRSDGEALARAFTAAGVENEQRTYEGVTHEFFGMTPVLAKAREAQHLATSALRGVFGTG